MQVRVEEVSPVEKKLVVEVPWDTISVRLVKAYKELGRSVQLKGFRKGKVPTSVLERMFGKRVKADVAVQLVRESFITAATEHKLDAVAEPHVEEDQLQIVKGQALSFETIVEVRGETAVENYREMPLSKRKLEIPENAVEQALEQVQREHTELRPIEGRDKLETSDFVALSVSGKIGDRDFEQPQMTIDLGNSEHQPVPGIVDAIVGLATDAKEQTVTWTVDKDHSDEEIAGKEASLKVTVIDARQKDVPAIDDELAKDSGDAEDLEGLKKVLLERIETRLKNEIASEVREAALSELIKRNQIPVANSLVERAADYKEQRFRSMLGIDASNELMNDELRAKVRDGADDEVRGQLLVDALAEKEKLEISDDDLAERVGEMAATQGSAPARLRAELEKSGRLEGLRFQLLQEKVLDFLVDRAVVTELTTEEYATMKAEEAKEAQVDEDADSAETPDSDKSE